MPVNRAGMLKAPVDRNPARPPRLQPQLLRARGVAPDLKDVEVLTRKDVPIAFEKRAPQMLRQRFERAAVLRIVGVNRIIVDPRAKDRKSTRLNSSHQIISYPVFCLKKTSTNALRPPGSITHLL